MRVLGLVLAGVAAAWSCCALPLSCPTSEYTAVTLNETAGLIHPTRVLYPAVPGAYPAFLFLHGFDLNVNSYDTILCEAATKNIVILFSMPIRFLHEALQEDAESLMPYLHDSQKGILPRIGTFLPGYSYTRLGLGGHSRGGGVIAHAYTNHILTDMDFSAVVFIDPVVTFPKTDLPDSVYLETTKVRALSLNPHSVCVTHGWIDAISTKISGADLTATNATECNHLDVVSGILGKVPLCHSKNGDECMQKARVEIAEAGFGANDLLVV